MKAGVKVINLTHLHGFFMQQQALRLYVRLFARKSLFPLHHFLYKLSLRGMGVLNYENEHVSGEKAFIRYLVAQGRLEKGVVLDVGAHEGDYAMLLRAKGVRLPIYAFEPHPQTFERLKQNAGLHGFTPMLLGLGSRAQDVWLYDYASAEGSQHASMYAGVIEDLRSQHAQQWSIKLTTVDDFLQEESLPFVSLLKMDTEGAELDVLKGASKAIADGRIGAIQFEFNDMNVISRTFLKDILDILPGYHFYRLLPDGLQPLGNYKAVSMEIFAYQNIVALRP
jgi:FkbM family methyltransferase